MRKTIVLSLALLMATYALPLSAKELLNSSYDISRELFAEINPLFIASYKQKTGETLVIKQTHAGSSRQAQAILQGLRADVVTFNQTSDVDVLYQKGKLLPENWCSRLANNSSPYYSTMAFLVRKGNPKNIHDWESLAKDGVGLVFPNPKTSGNARYTYLGAYGDALTRFKGDEVQSQNWLIKFLSNVVVFDTGGRGATTSFVERELGDVLITFESEVNNIMAQYPDYAFERVVPPTNILAEFPVAWIDKNVARNGTEKQAKAYLEFLYTKEAQQVLARYFYRVYDKDVVEKTAAQFPKTTLFNVTDVFGSWEKVQADHFASGALLDKLLAQSKR